MYLKEIGWKGVDWGYLAQDRDYWHAIVNVVQNLRAENAADFLTT
jgi:hypothetical protein